MSTKKMTENEIKRKISIRKNAYVNMIGEPIGYLQKKMDEKDLALIRERLYYNSNQLDEYSCNKVYSEIITSNRVKLFIKKSIRKILFKVLGWYYVPMVDGQIAYNVQVKQLIKDLQSIVDSQQEQIKELEDEVKVLQRTKG